MSYGNYNRPPSGYNQGPPGGFNGPPNGFNGPPGGGYNGPPNGYNGPPGGFNRPPNGFNGPPTGYNGPPPGGFNGPPNGFNGPPNGYNGPPPGGFNGPPNGYNGPPPGGFNGPPNGFNGPPGGFNGPPNGPPNGPNGNFRQQPVNQGGPGPNFNGPPQQPNYFALLKRAVNENELHAFYNDQQLQQIAASLPQKINRIAQAWNIPMMIAQDLARLALYDMILYVDDSGSIRACENGERLDDLKLIVSRAAFLGGILDSDGIQVRFMNSNVKGEHLQNEQQVFNLFQQVKFEGITPLGTELKHKIVEPLVMHPAKHNKLYKPVLVVTVTDGAPVGESTKKVFKVVEDVKKMFLKTRYRPGACSFQFAQVGNDMKAREFLEKLDTDPVVGKMVDCTSSFEIEEMEMSRAGVKLDPSTWIVKMFLGSVDPSYDKRDEVR